MGWQRGTHDHHCEFANCALCAHVGSQRGRQRRRRRRRRRLNPSCWQKALIYINIHHSDKQMSDSSPIFQRKPRLKAPIITTSQDSPKSPPSKKPVPPSPVVPEIDRVSATSQRVRSRSRFPGSPASQQGIAPASQQGIAPLGVPSVAPAGPRPKKNRRRAVPVPLSLEAQQAMSGAAEPGPSLPVSQQGIAPLGVPSVAPAGPRPKKNRRRAVPVPLSLEAQQAMSGAAEPGPSLPVSQAKKLSRRQQQLKNRFFALQAVECNSDGASVEASENSDDDWCLHPYCSCT